MTQTQAPPPPAPIGARSDRAAPPAAGGAKLVAIAVALALLAVVLNSLYIQHIRRQSEEDFFLAYVATRSLTPGSKVQPRDYKEMRLPRRFEKTFKDVGFLGESEIVTYGGGSKLLTRAVAQGEPLSFRHFQEAETEGIDKEITKGFRFVSLPVNSRTLPGALRKGMRVDLEAPFQTAQGVVTVLPVLENVQVVALGTQTAFDDDSRPDRIQRSYQNITIQVTPEEATDLANIARMTLGNFEVQLRNPGDTAPVKIEKGGINPEVRKLLADRTPPPARK
jgi:Flp pilus assembly protein CpaB